MTDKDSAIAATVMRERLRLGNFIRGRVRDQAETEDILQDVFYEFVEAYRLPEPIEHVSAWLFRVARNRIVDHFRKKKVLAISETSELDDDSELRLDLALPSPEAGPEAEYARSTLLKALQKALDELPENQREVFVAHEFEGNSFKEISARTGVTLNTLLARKRYAVLHLRARLQTVYDELEI
ncbi:sigma-70 family RNA polymerase sigma factor [Rhodanobacter sp. MP1X3]|uniref:RNA polymerase sigma factor n=1 Tax=Rhodanobacter sp. MP1X3 TaxID=2723086 RepID=UPI0016185164|nr:sigma-70 family RNA polymerase sigma factor [Rhodanobacter sp. MP1X3]MBB6243129.1 RNA polymerase sigma factor (sigma-70 family) [Rhodanobacter sp. MP1X3]